MPKQNILVAADVADATADASAASETGVFVFKFSAEEGFHI